MIFVVFVCVYVCATVQLKYWGFKFFFFLFRYLMFCKTVLKLDNIIQLVLNKCVSCAAQSKIKSTYAVSFWEVRWKIYLIIWLEW